MARIQILELPEGDGDDRPPFVLVIDQFDSPFLNASFDEFAKTVGARGVVATTGTIELPANDVPTGPDGLPVKFRVEPDFETFREQVQDEIRTAQQQVRQGIEYIKERYGAAPTSPGTNRQCAYGGGPSCACTADSSAGTQA